MPIRVWDNAMSHIGVWDTPCIRVWPGQRTRMGQHKHIGQNSINKIKITDYKNYGRLHWDYRPSVRDYSHVADLWQAIRFKTTI